MIRNPTDLTVRAWWHALRDAGKSFRAKDLSDNAAGLTYYSVLSIFPGLIVVVSLLGVLGTQDSIDAWRVRTTRAVGRCRCSIAERRSRTPSR